MRITSPLYFLYSLEICAQTLMAILLDKSHAIVRWAFFEPNIGQRSLASSVSGRTCRHGHAPEDAGIAYQ